MTSDFAAQVIAFMPTLTRYARSLCHSAEDAADLRGETVCRVLEHSNKYDSGKGSVATYCVTTMRNLFITEYNRRKRWADYVADQGNRRFDGIDAAHDFHLIRSECQKAEVILFADGYSYAEIQQIQGVPLGTVKRRIFIERKRLAEILNYDRFTAKKKRKPGRPILRT